MLLLTAISFVFSIESLGAWDGGLGIRPAVQLNGRPDPVEIEKMRAGRLFLVSRSRIELVPVIPEPNDDDLVQIMLVAGARNQHYLQLWRPAA